jgi:hypothetical protein
MPKYSFVLATRDDDWESSPGNRPIDRLRRTLAAITPAIPLVDAECVLVDWGSAQPISEQIDSVPWLRIVCVQPEISASCGSSFSEVHALNLAARAARGQWIARIDNDTFPGPDFSDWLIKEGPTPGYGYFSNRRDMAEGQCEPIGYEPVTHPPFMADFWRWHVGVLMLERSLWHELRGYDETQTGFLHMEHGFIHRINRCVPLVNLGLVLGCPFYHQWHTRDGETDRPQNKFMQMAELNAVPDVANDADWGMRRDFSRYG